MRLFKEIRMINQKYEFISASSIIFGSLKELASWEISLYALILFWIVIIGSSIVNKI